MAYSNVSNPNGFVPYEENAHSRVELRPVPSTRNASAGGNASTDLAMGDAYALDANGNAYRAGPNDTVRGIVIGFEPKGNPAVYGGQGSPSVDYITGTGTFPNLIGIEDSKTLFVVQADTLSASQVGGSYNLTDGAPDSTFHRSQQKLNVAGGAGVQFKAVRLKNSPMDNAYGTNAKVIVQMLQAQP